MHRNKTVVRLVRIINEEREKHRFKIRFHGQKLEAANPRAQLLLDLLDRKSFNPYHLELLQKMGYEVMTEERAVPAAVYKRG